MRRQISFLLVVVFLVPQLVSGQSIQAGSRVRVTHPGEGTRTGTVVALTADTLDVLLEGRSAAAHLPLEQVTRLDVSRGMEHHVLRRSGIGFLVGAGLGAVTGAIAESDCSTAKEFICLGAGGGALLGGIALGAVGGVVGLVAGLAPSERWERVTVQPRRVSLVSPSRSHGRGVGLKIAF
ncbi:MAG TPA: hypothetical protein VJT85_06545 [Gemmatimonadaceae bacterium]|nr:hypothetical protein [Gemmatimonadaceae bacterium]